MLTVHDIAKICHQTNKAFCQTIGDSSQDDWSLAPQWQKESAVAGVIYLMKNPLATNAALHNNWCEHKVKNGWVYGGVKDAEKKTHPCLVPFLDLPLEQQVKDKLFRNVVESCRVLY
jgi:hypothetical protein